MPSLPRSLVEIPVQDYFEYRYNAANQKQAMPLRFTPNVVYVLNVTDAPFYLHAGGTLYPTPDNADITIQPHSFYTFVPYNDTQEWAGFLDSPTAWDCIIWFRKGEANINFETSLYGIPDLGVAEILNPMPSPAVVADFTLDFVTWCSFSDFTVTKDGFFIDVPNDGSYVPGVGWETATGTFLDGISITGHTVLGYHWSTVTFFYTVAVGSGGLQLQIQTFTGVNPVGLHQTLSYTDPNEGTSNFITFALDGSVIRSLRLTLLNLNTLTPNPSILSSIISNGQGANPFLRPDNCP